jgi:hypothetical protein
MLTGEAPRRFSQKPITDLPQHVASKPWASHVLKVLRRATETAPPKRFQSVREFWDELSDALMPKTQLLSQLPASEETRPLSQVVASRAAAELPPEPTPARFEQPRLPAQGATASGAQRPRIVVPVTVAPPPAPVASAVQPNERRATDTTVVRGPYQVATTQYLGQTAALLIAFPTQVRDGRADSRLVAQAADLLTTTRLLLDSPAAADPELRGLLDDLELVLAQIARLRGTRAPAELDLITGTLEQRDVIPRLRSVAADVSSSDN